MKLSGQSNGRDKVGPQALALGQRVRDRRKELRLTRAALIDCVNELFGPRSLSLSTLRDIEDPVHPYALPKKWRTSSAGPRSSIEAIAQALDVPIGYLLAGASDKDLKASCFWPLIESRKIKLQNKLDAHTESYQEFVRGLPTSADALLTLPMGQCRNERAFAVIFRLEKAFSRLEMLLVNEPPLVFWDDEDLVGWITTMNLSGRDAVSFREEFLAYQEHFRELLRRGLKRYRVVLNRPALMTWLKRKTPSKARDQLNLIRRFLEYPSLELILYEADGLPPLEEAEIVSKHVEIPVSCDGTLAVQILQTPPGHSPTEYFVTPYAQSPGLVRRQKDRIDLAWRQGVEYGRRVGAEAGISTKDPREIARYLLAMLGNDLETFR